MTADFINPQGERTHGQSIARFDGKAYPVAGAQEVTTRAFTRIDGRTYEQVTRVNGKVTQTVRVVVSADGRTRTSTETQPGTAERPAQHNMLVYEKQ